MISTRHPWDHVTCACGALSASGRPWRPRIHWRATSGGGWSELDETTQPESEEPPGGEGRRRIGF